MAGGKKAADPTKATPADSLAETPAEPTETTRHTTTLALLQALALKIIRVTGAPLPRLEADPSKLDYDFRCFFLHRPRIELCRRIDVRVEEMALPHRRMGRPKINPEVEAPSVVHAHRDAFNN
eukprot:jgi/Tetstr1/449649/TSEL_036717.t1